MGQTPLFRPLALALLSIALAGCSLLTEEEGTPTLSSESVIRTAEAMAEQTRQVSATTPIPRTPTASPTTIESSPSPAPTSSPGAPTVTANYNANVRSGPDEAYPVEDFLLQGQSARVLGRYENAQSGTWWFISRDQGIDGWIWGGAVAFSGNANIIPALTPPPSPTPIPVTTSPPGTATATSPVTATPSITPTQ